jgi:putative hydroxymethylpyrimidine transport system substrate-binding protein
LIYVANPDTMNAYAIARFLDATAQATNFILNQPDRAWEIFSGTASELQTELNVMAWADTWPRFATRPAALDAGRYARFEAFLAAREATPGGLSVNELALDVTAEAAR